MNRRFVRDVTLRGYVQTRHVVKKNITFKMQFLRIVVSISADGSIAFLAESGYLNYTDVHLIPVNNTTRLMRSAVGQLYQHSKM